MRLALTADLHWGSHANGDLATRAMVAFLREAPPEVLALAGDVGAGEEFARCLDLFAGLATQHAVIPGNHDIWVTPEDSRGDSLAVYERQLPALASARGFHYLDGGPLRIAQTDLSLVGSMNWYDYSWSKAQLREMDPDWEARLQHKLFSRGRHNDARFVRWPLDDVGFSARAVETFERHLQEGLTEAAQAIVITHHPAFRGLCVPRAGPPTLDDLLWDAFSGNTLLEEVLKQHAHRIAFAFSGHTHRECESVFHGIRGYNIGGDYGFKRLLVLDWPSGNLEAHVFRP